MSKYGSDQVAFFFVDGYDLKGVQTEFSPDAESMFEDAHGLGEAWRAPLATGIRMGTLAQSGFYDDATGSVHEALNDQQGVSRVVGFGLAGNVVGRRFTGMAGAYAGRYSRMTTRGQLHKANAQYTVSGEVDEGVILQELEQKSADWDTEGADSVDAGASSANGGAGYLFVKSLALGGHDDLTVKIRHSADDTTYVDLITFTAVTAARAAERKTVTGTVNRHLAVSGVFGGAGAPTAEVAVGFARG